MAKVMLSGENFMLPLQHYKCVDGSVNVTLTNQSFTGFEKR